MTLPNDEDKTEFTTQLLKSVGYKIVEQETEEDMDLVQDIIDVITSMCTRIYGKRSTKQGR